MTLVRGAAQARTLLWPALTIVFTRLCDAHSARFALKAATDATMNGYINAEHRPARGRHLKFNIALCELNDVRT